MSLAYAPGSPNSYGDGGCAPFWQGHPHLVCKDFGTDDFNLTYFKTGAMKNDGENYKYIWDAFGRLKEVLDRSDDSLVAEYTYNGLGFRISEHHDTDNDGDVDGSDATYHFVFDERWRIVATYRNDDANPKEQFVHHCAGAGGYGSSSYIDAVILRDVDLSTAWDAQADALDTRHYYCQNWRADVSVIIDDSAVLVERIMYSPYGVPFGIPVGDLVASGGAEPADGGVRGADSTALTGTYWGSSYNIADLDNDGDVDSADQTIQSNNNGATLGWGALTDTHNRLGYAGYVFDEALAGTKWHVRHRVLESVLGRWVSRDRLEYVDGANLYQYAVSTPTVKRDPTGLWCTWCICTSGAWARTGRVKYTNCSVTWPRKVGAVDDCPCTMRCQNKECQQDCVGVCIVGTSPTCTEYRWVNCDPAPGTPNAPTPPYTIPGTINGGAGWNPCCESLPPGPVARSCFWL